MKTRFEIHALCDRRNGTRFDGECGKRVFGVIHREDWIIRWEPCRGCGHKKPDQPANDLVPMWRIKQMARIWT